MTDKKLVLTVIQAHAPDEWVRLKHPRAYRLRPAMRQALIDSVRDLALARLAREQNHEECDRAA